MKTIRVWLIILSLVAIMAQSNKIQAFQAVEDRQRVRTANCFKALIFYGVTTVSFLATLSCINDAYHGNNGNYGSGLNSRSGGLGMYVATGAACLLGWAYIKNLISEPGNR